METKENTKNTSIIRTGAKALTGTDEDDFGQILHRSGIEYQAGKPWLTVGGSVDFRGYLFFIPIRITEIQRLLELLLPLVKGNPRIHIRIPKDVLEASKINNGYYGTHLYGKAVQLATGDLSEALGLAATLGRLTRQFQGAFLSDAIRLDHLLYIAHTDDPTGTPTRNILERYSAFRIDKDFRRPPKRRMIGNRYLPVHTIQRSHKGSVYKGIDLAKMEWCLIKQGNAHAVDDVFGRDIRDRLSWQREVLKELAGHAPIPRYLDYVSYDAFHFLVTEYIEGQTLQQYVKRSLHNDTWPSLTNTVKHGLLAAFAEVLDGVALLHRMDYVHRDITPNNFVVRPDASVALLDLELSYGIRQQRPHPPFVTGTFGYISPEQLRAARPSTQQDIFSLGALFVYLVTGRHPTSMLTPSGALGLIGTADMDIAVAKELCWCFAKRPKDRPSIEELMLLIHGLQTNLQV